MTMTNINQASNGFDYKRIKNFINKYAIFFILLLLIAGIGLIQPSFLTPANLVNILRVSSIRIVIALGVGLVLLTRGTDLSAGRIVGLTACIAASMLQRSDYTNRMYTELMALPIIVPILFAVFIGLLVGLVNGVVVAFLSVPPFITTLGTMVIVWGAASIYVDRPPRGAEPLGGLRPDFTEVGTGMIAGIPYLVLIAALITFVIWVLLNKTRLGKNIYAIGGNPEAALVAGIKVKPTLVVVYALAGALYGLAGVLLSARTGGATNNYGLMYELDAIAACVIGGVSTSGGIGTVWGMLAGVFMFEVLNNGLAILGVSAYWQQIVKGLIIVTAVALDIRKYVRKR